jgi:FHS family glucose/mannose:H+ symporter-like MFS transporter
MFDETNPGTSSSQLGRCRRFLSYTSQTNANLRQVTANQELSGPAFTPHWSRLEWMMNPEVPAASGDLARSSRRGSRALISAPLYLGFAATGVGVALPGALLPAMLLRWHLGDEQGGRLFLLAWMGSSFGALLVRGSLRRTLLAGSIGVALGATGLGFCEGHGADAWMALYGLGLGVTMTSISLVRQWTSGGSGTELVRLNLLWAIGACACPSLTIGALTGGHIGPVFCGLALCFVLLAGWTFSQPDLTIEEVGTRTAQPWTVFRKVPPGLILMTLLITGIEASAGGWLATYARREGHAIAEVIAAPTCFWAGLLLSRLFWSLCDRWLTHDWTVRGSVALMAGASLLLIATGSGLMLLVAAFCLGFGIGPTYPLLLAWALRFQRGGAIFFLAGVGSACLPWLTGLVSAERHSLRLGLAVPMIATMVMVTMSLVLPLALWSQRDTSMTKAT